MPEYLAPGVFVEETSFRSKSIEGVSTSTTAFVGLTRFGPAGGEPELLTSFGDFERIYGGLNDLALGGGLRTTNYLAHAAAAYFSEGGARLYISRAIDPAAAAARSADLVPAPPPPAGGGGGGGGGAPAPAAMQIRFVARFPGAAGNGRVVLDETRTPSSVQAATAAPAGSLMFVRTPAAAGAPGNNPLAGAYFIKIADGAAGTRLDAANAARAFVAADEAVANITINGQVEQIPGMELVTLNVTMVDADNRVVGYEDLGYDSRHRRFAPTILAAAQTRRADDLTMPCALVAETPGAAGAPAAPAVPTAFQLIAALSVPYRQARAIPLTTGTDGAPQAGHYITALAEITGLDDVSIVAAPGSTAYAGIGAPVQRALITHAEQRRAYRIAVLDTDPDLLSGGARQAKAQLDSKYAALYYPWVWISNPLAGSEHPEIPKEILVPPSGFVSGIYARNDNERGVHKAPANEVIRGALRFERLVTTGEQEMLNPLGVNCLRFFPGRGFRVWGARTTSSDPEWKYVNIRRYFNYLEHSIDRGTQWAVFEPNGERLWANVVETVKSFLYNEWVSGALLGTTQEQAFFVRCDRSTITQNDLDNGRLICLIGVAAIKPAEFVIFRIGQKTTDSK